MAGGVIDTLFEALGDQPAVRVKGQSLMAGDKMFVYASGDRLVLKLPAGQVKALLNRKGFAPHLVGTKVMSEWVAVTRPQPSAYLKDLPLLRQAIEFVSAA